MDQNYQKQPEAGPHDSADFGKVPNDSESFGNVPNDSESFRTMRNDSEGFRNIPNVSERKESHTLTVREAARLFEAAGVARTERSIVNWCQPNKLGIPRLDNYFDPNERRYFISLQSVEMAISEEKAKAVKGAASEPVGIVPNDAEEPQTVPRPASETDSAEVRELEKEVFDLKINNRAKDYFIERLEKERDGFFNQLLAASRKVGELETKLLGSADDSQKHLKADISS
jgi:hypothetical protein